MAQAATCTCTTSSHVYTLQHTYDAGAIILL